MQPKHTKTITNNRHPANFDECINSCRQQTTVQSSNQPNEQQFWNKRIRSLQSSKLNCNYKNPNPRRYLDRRFNRIPPSFPSSSLSTAPELPRPISPSPPSLLSTALRRRYSDQTSTTWTTHWTAYPATQSLTGTFGRSLTVTASMTAEKTAKAKFHEMSRTTTGRE